MQDKIFEQVGMKLPQKDAQELLATSITKFKEKKYKESMEIFIFLYEKGIWCNEVLAFILENFSYPNHDEFESCYNNNISMLKKYTFLQGNNIPVFSDLDIIGIFCGEEYYAFFDSQNNVFSKIYRIARISDLGEFILAEDNNPFLMKNECNLYHWEYLQDNVRKSDDFGADNHIYMYYDNIKLFYLLLQVADITQFLIGEKFVFLLGEGSLEKFYPLDFKEMYHIDYSQRKPNKIKVHEVKRIIVNWFSQTMSGNYFLAGVLDYHKNLLTIKEFGLAGFARLHEKFLKGKSVREAVFALENGQADSKVYNEIMFLFKAGLSDTMMRFPTQEKFFLSLAELFPTDYKPNKIEWFKGLFLAYSYALGRHFKQRVAPAIVFQTHGMGVPVRREDMYDVYRNFKYFRGITIIRRPTVTLGARVDLFEKEEPGKYNYIEKIVEFLLKPKGELEGLFLPRKDEFLPNRAAVRFEDLKLYPKATLHSVCKFLGIEWDDMLLSVTANGVEHEMVLDAGKRKVSGFDKAPVYNLHEQSFSPFDYYRMELVMEKQFSFWGYRPFYHKDGTQYSDDEIRKLFEVHFKCEELHFTKEQFENNIGARKKMFECINDLLKNPIPLEAHGQKMIPLSWIKPDLSLLEGELYD